MLDDIAKDIAETIKESVSKGMEELSKKFEARIKALEDKPSPELLKGDKGDSISIDEVKPLVDEAMQSVKAPEVDYDAINAKIETEIASAVDNLLIPSPKDGENGKDALEIEIIPEIDEEKSYSRGSYAVHKGGLWRSYEKTHGMRGWECIVDGVHEIDVDYDGERKAVIKLQKSSGAEVTKEIKIPAILGKGVWREGSYEKGDTVQLSGSTWQAIKDTKDRPGESKSWIMAAKVGGTGKSAYDIAKQAGFTGTKQEWLESLGKKPVVKI